MANTNKYKFNKGDTVWFFAPYDVLSCGVITGFTKSEQNGRTYAAINGTNGTVGCMHAKLDECHATKQECIDAKRDKNEKEQESLREGIRDVNDLVRFMYDNCIACADEYTDWNARAAARSRAKELLGIELGD